MKPRTTHNQIQSDRKNTYSYLRYRSINFRIFLSGIVLWLFLAVMPTLAQEGQKIFQQDCATCHKIGQKFIGPNLEGVTEKHSKVWLKKFIKGSQQMVKSGDPMAVSIFEEFNQIPMPDNPHLDEAALEALIAYLADPSGPGLASVTEKAPNEAAEPETDPEYSTNDVLSGMALFMGKDRLANGGPNCISCHHANHKDVFSGGLLARDLTNAYDRIGDAGVKSITTTPPFPVMAEAYRKYPVTEEEAFYLAAFLQHVNDGYTNQQAQSGDSVFFVWGGIGFFTILLLIILLWNNRKTNSVKKEIFERQLKSI